MVGKRKVREGEEERAEGGVCWGDEAGYGDASWEGGRRGEGRMERGIKREC